MNQGRSIQIRPGCIWIGTKCSQTLQGLENETFWGRKKPTRSLHFLGLCHPYRKYILQRKPSETAIWALRTGQKNLQTPIREEVKKLGQSAWVDPPIIVIIVIIILVLLVILVLKMTKTYHITWYWCQNIRDSMVEKRVNKFGQGPPPPLFGQCPKEIDFFL